MNNESDEVLDTDIEKGKQANLLAAQAAGAKYGLICAGIGLTLAYLIIAVLFYESSNLPAMLFWVASVDFSILINVVFLATALFFLAYSFGRMTARLVVENNYNSLLSGALAGLFTLVLSTAVGTVVLIIEASLLERISVTQTLADDFVFIPGFMVVVFGAIPAIIAGMWLGEKVKAAGQSY